MTDRSLATYAARLILLGGVVLSLAFAWAGTRWVQTTGGIPTAATDGVVLDGVTACRGSVRYTDGGAVSGGSLVPYYYDTILGWVEAKTSDQCSLATDTLLDGGARRVQTCEFSVQAQYGRAALATKALTPQAIAVTRLECWGPQIPFVSGGAQP